MPTFADESSNGFLRENVASPAAHIPLLDVGLELAPEVDWLRVVVWLKHVAQVLHHGVRVVVCLEEPVRIIQVVLIQIPSHLTAFIYQSFDIYIK